MGSSGATGASKADCHGRLRDCKSARCARLPMRRTSGDARSMRRDAGASPGTNVAFFAGGNVRGGRWSIGTHRRCHGSEKLNHGHARHQSSPRRLPLPPPSSLPVAPAAKPTDRRLRLDDILKLMVADGLVAAAEADELGRSRTARFEHPLEAVADRKWKSLLPPHKVLTLDWLVEWLAGKLGVPYHAHRSAQDRLRGGDRVMSSPTRSATASCRWRSTAATSPSPRASRSCGAGRTSSRRSSSCRDQARARQPGRHRALPGRVLQPRQVDEARAGRPRATSQRLSQLRAAGRAGQGTAQARRQRPAHRPHRRLAVAVRLRAARERHPPRAAARRRHACASASTACCTRSTRSRTSVLMRDDHPHQDPRRAWTWSRSAARRTAASRRARPTARRSSCACRRCPPPSARSS